ncbi:MAG: DUF2220 family protein [Deltaproteobacteria bacterium]|nr:DUF2220 family protein [Deltaproteobacteria bacterium]
MSEHPVLAAYRRAHSRNPTFRRLVERVLDRRDRDGVFPRTLGFQGKEAELEELGKVLPAAAVAPRKDGITLRLDVLARLLVEDCEELGAVPLCLETTLDTLAGREPRDRRAEAATNTRELLSALEEGARDGLERASARLRALGQEARRDPEVEGLVARTLEEAGRGVGPFAALYRAEGPAVARQTLERLVTGLLLARHPALSGRVDDLSRWVGGHTKILRPGGADHGRLCDTLLTLDPDLAATVEAERPGSQAIRRRFTLEHCDFVGNLGGLDVLVQGPLTLEVGAETLEDPTRLHREGLPAKLPLPVLRRARRARTSAGRVLTVENESAFHTLAARPEADDLLVYTGGQAGWAVVLLLKALARDRPDLELRHTGDLDRAGLEIWRSLAHRSGLKIEPLWMDAATHARFRAAGLRLSQAAEARILRTLAGWREPHGRDLLEALLETGVWIEQETVLAHELPII